MSAEVGDKQATGSQRKKALAEAAALAKETDALAKFAMLERRAAWFGVLCGVRLLLIALWLGGAFFFSFVVAPTAFSVLPTHELAGAMVTRTIAFVNGSGFVVSLLLLVSAFAVEDRWDVSRRAWLGELLSLSVIAVACGVGHWYIAAKMIALRDAMGRPIDQVAIDDPSRLAFNSLHAYSVATMGVALVAGVVALLLIGRRNRIVTASLVTKVESLDR